MKNIHIENSYNIWSINYMFSEIIHQCHLKYASLEADKILNRSYKGMYVEWYLHNLGYWFTLPFIKNPEIAKLNTRFKDLDLEEHKPRR